MAELALMTMGVSAGTASTVGTIATIGMTAASAFSSMQAGKQEAAALNLQARQAGLNARLERLKGKQQAVEIQSQLNRDLASQNALFAARGGLAGEGSSLAAQMAARENATRDIDIARFNSEIGALNAEQRQSMFRSDAKSAKRAGMMNAVSTIAGTSFSTGMPGIENMAGQSSGFNPAKMSPKRKPSLIGR